MMLRIPLIVLFSLLSVAAIAQTAAPAENPPAEVDQALRARINEFYTLLKNQEYRKAEALVADDTKEYYYEGSKPELRKFALLDVTFSDNFTLAKVITQCTQQLMIPGFPANEVSVKVPSTWRFEKDNWFLYVDQTRRTSVVGLPMKPVPSSAMKAPGSKEIEVPKEIAADPDFAMGKVKFDKAGIQLTAGGTDRLTITNSSNGPALLVLGAPLKGIDAKLDRTTLAGGEKAILTLKAGAAPTAGTFYLQLLPTGEVIAIPVEVKPAK